MANTFSLIATQTVGAGGAATILFSGIPQSFTDLILFVSTRGTDTNQTQSLYFNGDLTATNYNRLVYGLEYGASNAYAYSINDAGGAGFVNPSNASASIFASSKFYIGNYSLSGQTKTNFVYAQTENQAQAAFGTFTANRWSGTDAINAIRLQSIGNFVQYSSASLYGISKTV
jgi:hypothetical protein